MYMHNSQSDLEIEKKRNKIENKSGQNKGNCNVIKGEQKSTKQRRYTILKNNLVTDIGQSIFKNTKNQQYSTSNYILPKSISCFFMRCA